MSAQRNSGIQPGPEARDGGLIVVILASALFGVSGLSGALIAGLPLWLALLCWVAAGWLGLVAAVGLLLVAPQSPRRGAKSHRSPVETPEF